jgi:putative thiamine transport system substrate-binding protein
LEFATRFRDAAAVAAVAALVCIGSRGGAAHAAERSASWAAIERAARGQTVYFNAWAGDTAINDYIAWTGREVERRYAVKLVHVKLAETAAAVNRIIAEKAGARDSNGSVDLLWINGENFALLMQRGLLHGGWTELPNARLLDTQNPTISTDFTLPTQGFELAWGGARFALMYEAGAVAAPVPRDPAALLHWIRAHPGRFTYPQPPDFLGAGFLEQMLLLLSTDRERLQRPVGADFATVTQPLWDWLDAARPTLWRAGRIYPRSGPEQRRLLADGELDWAPTFNPSEANRAIRTEELPATIRAVHFRGGTLSNSHFLAIPFNARAKEAAMVVANFLLSPEAQARKADEAIWGDPTVLAMDGLSAADRLRFSEPRVGPAYPRVDGPLLAEPHASWTRALDRAWLDRYGSQ